MKENKQRSKLVPELRFAEFVGDGEWEYNILGEIAKFSKGKGVSKKDITNDGKLFCIRYGELYTYYNEIIDEVISKTNLPEDELVLSNKDDVIIPSSGETQIDIAKASCVLREGIALGGDLNIIRSKINGKFLSYYLNGSKKREIAQMAQGVSVMHLYNSQLEKLEIEIPTPQEQQKIAATLSSLDDLLQAETERLALLKEHKKGLLQQLFPKQGEKVPQLRFEEFVGDGAWEETTLGDLGEIFTGKTPSTKNQFLWNGKILFITPTDISENKYQVTTKRTIKKTEKLKVLPPNSIVYTCIASIGKMAMTTHKSVTNQQINSIVPSEIHENEFIYYLLVSLTPYIKSITATSTLPIINKAQFCGIKCKIPKQKEQQKIANTLSSVDKLIEAQSQKLDSLKAHKKGLMQGMFPNTNTL